MAIDATFRARWQEENSQLNHLPNNFLSTIISKVYHCLFCLPNSLIAAIINPRSHITPNNAVGKILTPDQVKIQARIATQRDFSHITPTVILFNPLGNNDNVYFNLRNHLLRNGLNVATFNYRGYQKTWSIDDLVLDGDSVFQYVRNQLQIDLDKIHFFGSSLGGAIAAKVKALHPEATGKYIGDRTFKSIYSLLTKQIYIGRLGSLVKRITKLIVALFIAYPVYLLGWELDGKRALRQMNGDRLVTFHPNDALIPFDASLASCCDENNRLSFNNEAARSMAHASPLESLLAENGIGAHHYLTHFLKS